MVLHESVGWNLYKSKDISHIAKVEGKMSGLHVQYTLIITNPLELEKVLYFRV